CCCRHHRTRLRHQPSPPSPNSIAHPPPATAILWHHQTLTKQKPPQYPTLTPTLSLTLIGPLRFEDGEEVAQQGPDVLELAGNAARDNNKNRIVPYHIQLAVRNDEELGRLLGSVTISNGGVMPNIHQVLLPKKLGKKGKIGTESHEFLDVWCYCFDRVGVLNFLLIGFGFWLTM
ncbi:hypothetical protein Drorol1_Dr00000138, partial [Drosera rotundifolia]